MAVEYVCCGSGFFIHIAVVVFLVIFAGLMSGLTLGLMSMSLVDLEVLAKSGTPKDRIYADQFKAINDKGMPMYQRPFMKGKMYIHFSIDFPNSLIPEQSKMLEIVLPPRNSVQLTDIELDECEETIIHDMNIE